MSSGRPREKIWVVRAGDGNTLVQVLERAGEGASAISAGRVFVGKKRATRADQPVRVGDTVRIGAGASGTPPKIEILFHEDELVATVKPAGLPTVPDHAGASHSLVALVAKEIGAPSGDLRVTSRLDRDVSGVVVFALSSAAEERLRGARAAGRYERRYVALAMPGPARDGGVWDAPIGRASDPRLRAVRGPDAKAAMTRWRKIATAPASGGPAMLAVDPVTGRTHQIRVHASAAGAPLIGDRDYGGSSKIILANGRILAPARIALHAARVVVPGTREPLEARAPIPPDLGELWSALGGQADAWELAVASDTRTDG
ncbi:MAG TPA: RluA family pseudouridine synthase [Labilithrix sp.]|nr:RluA family pseudouridine synthase [Labilithrix sp.]